MAGTHAVRFHGDEIDFGVLDSLAGHWQGANGFNMIALPDQKGSFTLLVEPYIETLIIEKVPATTPNRGMTGIEMIPTLQYSTTISVLNKGTLMHVEGGFWELSDPEVNDGFDIFRIASVPHGNAVEAMGKSSVIAGPPDIPKISGLPTADHRLPLGYTEGVYEVSVDGFSPETPNDTLVKYLDAQKASGLEVIETVTLDVSTTNKGGIANIASLRDKVVPTQLDATFWLETLRDAGGHIYRQLQYSQRVIIEFPISRDAPGKTIVWPHISVNTLSVVT